MFRDQSMNNYNRFYRFEISHNLFGEYSLLREWGIVGLKGRQMINLFPDLRSVSLAADDVRNKTLKRGYVRDIMN